jgi:YgiT-type zinc finger domain-containing protein
MGCNQPALNSQRCTLKKDQDQERCFMKTEENKDEIEAGEPVSPCPECLAGIMRLNYITYFTWLNEELVTVPNFPAWVCDMCGRREFDSRAITWLNTLLNPAAGSGKPGRLRKRTRQQGGDQPQL